MQGSNEKIVKQNTVGTFFRLDCLDCHKKPVDQFSFSVVSATYVYITAFNYITK